MKYSKELHDAIRRNTDGKIMYAVNDDGFLKPYNIVEITHVLLDEIERLQAERRWIPVSERLPEQNEVVLLWDRICSQQVLAQFHQFKRYAVWYIDGEDIHLDFSKDQFVSWMPLPPAPESEG